MGRWGGWTLTVFSVMGCVLLSLFANLPRGKVFRGWVREVLGDAGDMRC